uniref:Uncharacterized protein n=1 Tax=Zea mays TaxID=4577 RepID=C4J7F3_MAIZE|nr:unknown [Zea mays]
MTIMASYTNKTQAEKLCNFRKRFTADEGGFFKTFFADFAFGLAFFNGVGVMGPGWTPFFSALPLGVAEGGSLKHCGGKGL